ncbi:MAG: NAD(P)-binding domain-containing protein, partial [Ignisphaera sp.]|nr:NAD(P)-binding domain-containing protein [Ignisphaera sp.]
LDGDLDLISGRIIAVVGFGNQGRAWATTLRDSKLHVIVGNIRDAAYEEAVRAGFETYSIGEAASKADIIALLLPDEVAPRVFYEEIEPHVRGKPHYVLVFASGYNVAYGFIEPPQNADTVMVAPRMIGAGILDLHRQGRGYPVLLAVARDVSGNAWGYAKAVAKGIGAIGRPGGVAIRSSFEEEALVDLLTEQTWSPLLIAAFMAYFEVVTKEFGVSPEVAILELYASGELAEVAKHMAELGLLEQLKLHSRTSQYGHLTRLKRYLTEDLKDKIRQAAREIISGEFAKEWALEQLVGLPTFKKLHKELAESMLAKAERELYRVLGRR